MDCNALEYDGKSHPRIISNPWLLCHRILANMGNWWGDIHGGSPCPLYNLTMATLLTFINTSDSSCQMLISQYEFCMPFNYWELMRSNSFKFEMLRLLPLTHHMQNISDWGSDVMHVLWKSENNLRSAGAPSYLIPQMVFSSFRVDFVSTSWTSLHPAAGRDAPSCGWKYPSSTPGWG